MDYTMQKEALSLVDSLKPCRQLIVKPLASRTQGVPGESVIRLTENSSNGGSRKLLTEFQTGGTGSRSLLGSRRYRNRGQFLNGKATM